MSEDESHNASYPEKKEIERILSEHLHPVGEGSDLFYYDKGWSDLRVSQSVRNTLTASPAAKMRKDMFGKLAYAQGGPGKRVQDARMTMVERQIRQLANLMSLSGQERALIFGVDTNEDGGDISHSDAPKF